jgi:transcription antitermination protein NusB
LIGKNIKNKKLMLSRRNLRIKVMQVLYAHLVGSETDSSKLEKILVSRINKAEDLYFVFLLYLVEICNYSVVDASKKASKFIQTENDKNASTDLSNNAVLLLFKDEYHFLEPLDRRGLHGYVDPKLVRNLFKILYNSQKYQNYISIKEKTFDDDVAILRYIVKKVIGASEEMEEMLEQHFINIVDDHFTTLQSIQKKLKDFKEETKENFLNDFLLKDLNSEDVDFSKELLKKYIQNQDEFEGIVQPRLKNWELDRVAVIDIILIKMAICEMKYFPSIPLKVTLNEYIDISKEYSTPKSKDFINGILDKVMKDLKDKGEIKKTGRGLINN